MPERRTLPFWAVGAWALVAGLGAIAVVRATGWDGTAPGVVALAILPWVLCLAWPLVVVAALKRRFLLAAGSLVLVGAHLWWIVPQFTPVASTVRPRPGAPVLRVLDANVTWYNQDMSGIIAQIRERRPDVVALEEVTPSDLDRLAASHVLDRFGARLVAASGSSEGMALWSTVPLTGAQVWDDAGHPALRAVLHQPGAAATTLLVVHPYIPIGLPVGQWHAEMGAVLAAVRSTTGPTIVAGDFNATWDMPEFQRVLHAGFRDAAVVAGRGWRMTWSPASWFPGVVRIDHVLVSASVGVVSYRIDGIAGTGHRALTATLALPATG